MKALLNIIGVAMLGAILVAGCKNRDKGNAGVASTATTEKKVVYKGLYSFGPEVKSFKDCANGEEYWAADSSAKLELSYSQLHFEKPYEPVYVEVEGEKVKSGKDGLGSEFDSTIVVKKVIKITRDIPDNMCK